MIDWVTRRDGVSFRHAAELLLEGAGRSGLEGEIELDPEASDAELLRV